MASITVKNISEEFHKVLKGMYPPEEIRNFVWIIMEHLLDFTKTDLLVKDDTVLSDDQLSFCKDAMEKLAVQVPVQQIVESTVFYDLKFEVTPDVLIPRPETEELVHWILDDLKQRKEVSILDVGTGSGCIPISIKVNHPQAIVSAWDISDKALNVAKSNANLNQVDILFEKQDALNPELNERDKVDVIVSNPPYIRELEKERMQKNVLDYEPHLALFVADHDPLIFYRRIAEWGRELLSENGCLYYEINEAFGKETCEMLQELGYQSIELRKDLFGKDRMVKAIWK